MKNNVAMEDHWSNNPRFKEALAEPPAQQDIPKIGCVNHDCDKCKKAQQQEPSVAAAWQQGYDQGVADERTSEANIGIAGFDAKVNPARNNPYSAKQPAQQQEPVAWRELCHRLYVELFHCDQQMMATLDEDGEPVWTQGKTVRDVLADAKAALDTSPPASKPLTDDQTWKFKLQLEKDAEMKIPEKPFRHVVRAIEAAHGIKGDA